MQKNSHTKISLGICDLYAETTKKTATRHFLCWFKILKLEDKDAIKNISKNKGETILRKARHDDNVL